MKALNYILAVIIIGMTFVLISNDISKNNVIKSNNTENLKKDSLLAEQKNLIIQYQAEPLKIDTFYTQIEGVLEKQYLETIEKYKDSICKLQKKEVPELFWDDNTELQKEDDFDFTMNEEELSNQILVDSVKDNKVTIKYNINYFGLVKGVQFSYKLHDLKTVETKYIYENVYVDVPQPYFEPQRSMYGYLSTGVFQTHLSAGVDYYTKKGLGLGVGFNMAKFEKYQEWWTIKISYKLF